jgi:hypothetical protein
LLVCLVVAFLVKEYPLDGAKSPEAEQRTDPESVAPETTSEGERSRPN